MANVKVNKADGTTANLNTVKGSGKTMTTKNMRGFKDDKEIVTFRNNERVKFKFIHPKEMPEKKKHVPDGHTVMVHPLDAAAMEAAGKGKVVEGTYQAAKKD